MKAHTFANSLMMSDFSLLKNKSASAPAAGSQTTSERMCSLPSVSSFIVFMSLTGYDQIDSDKSNQAQHHKQRIVLDKACLNASQDHGASTNEPSLQIDK